MAGFDQESAAAVLVQRDHPEFRHSDYFYEANYRDNWIPFFSGCEPPRDLPPRQRRGNWRHRVTKTLFILVVAIVAILGARQCHGPNTKNDNKVVSELPSSTAWFVGGKVAIDANGQLLSLNGKPDWVTGPNYIILQRTRNSDSPYPLVGDIVKVLSDRPLYVIHVNGRPDIHIAPTTRGVGPEDDLWLQLATGARAEVRQVSYGYLPKEDHAFLWIRGAAPPNY